MAKASEHEVLIRVHEVYSLLVRGASRYRVVHHASRKWGVSDRQADTYIAEARKLLMRDAEIQRPEWLATSLAILQEQIQAELSGPNGDGTGVNTNNRLAALQFIRTQAQLLQFKLN
jgi:hypothetical protein